MKINVFAIFLFIILVASCSPAPLGIVSKSYESEKMFFDTYRFTFDIHLENISNSKKISDLIERLIYQNKNFDDYITLRENEFIGNLNREDYPPMIDEDGKEYFYHSDLIVNYVIEHYDESFVIFYYEEYFYYTGTAHGSYWVGWFILDIAEERLLGINDLVNQIPDYMLKENIESKYEIYYFLREGIWPPDSVNIQKDNITLLWNIYSITSYSHGLIYIDIPDTINEPYLTEKGKIIKKALDKP